MALSPLHRRGLTPQAGGIRGTPSDLLELLGTANLPSTPTESILSSAPLNHAHQWVVYSHPQEFLPSYLRQQPRQTLGVGAALRFRLLTAFNQTARAHSLKNTSLVAVISQLYLLPP